MSQLIHKARRVPLGSICEFINGRAFKPSDWSLDGLPIVRIQNLNNQDAKFNYFKGEVRPRFLIDSGALLFAWSGTPGTSFGTHVWNGGPAVLNQHIFNILFDDSAVSKQFLRFALNEKLNELIDQAHGGVGLQHVTKGVVERTEILLPSMNEQNRVADILLRAEAIVRLRREAQRKAQAIAPALFVNLFGDPDSNPQRWPISPLGEVLKSIDSGHSPKCHDRPRDPDEWGVLRLSAISPCDYDESKHKTLPDNVDADPSVEVKAGDILLSRKNTPELVGASAYVWGTTGRILLPDLIFRLVIADKTRLHPVYLWQLLTTINKRQSLRRLASGSAGSMPNISKERLRTLAIEVPNYALQAKFADLVVRVRSIEHQQAAALRVAEDTFNALLSSTFNGRDEQALMPKVAELAMA